MSFDPNESDVNRQVDASMKMFERAKVGTVAPIVPAEIRSVLLCFDGSSQDEAVADAGMFFASKDSNRKLLSLSAIEPKAATGNAGNSMLADMGNMQKVESSHVDAYDRILDIVAQHSPDIVVVPCPFGRDFASVGADSAGTVIDVLLKRCKKPMLIIRRADQTLEAAAKNAVMVVGSENESESNAARLMLGMLRLVDSTDKSVALNLVLGEEQVENISQLLDILAPDAEIDRQRLENALAAAHARLDTALRNAATEQGFRYRMIPRTNATRPQEIDVELLVVLPLEADDQFGQGFVQHQIRQSPHPLLVVPEQGPR